MNRDYSKIKVSVWREKGGHLVTELTTVSGKFVMMYVSSRLSDEIEDVVQTALRCLSRKDLEGHYESTLPYLWCGDELGCINRP